jgi:hypothetical protein
LVQNILQGYEVMDVRSGIFKGFGRERTPSPVSSLESFALINSDTQQISGKGFQTQLGDAGEASGDAGIE